MTARITLRVAVFVTAAAVAHAASPGQASLEEGRRAYSRGEWPAAAAAFRRAVEADPGLSGGWRDLALALSKLGRTEEAIRILDNLIRVDGEDAAVLQTAGEIESGRKAWGAAARRLAEAVRVDPERTTARMRLAEALEAQGKVEESLRQWDAVLSRTPRSSPARMARLRLLERMGREAEALEEAVRLEKQGGIAAHELDLTVARLQAHAGDKAYAEGDYAAARAAYAAALLRAPRDPRLLANAGWAARRAGATGDAVSAWTRSLESGGEPSLWRAIADVHRDEQRYAEARKAYDSAAAADPAQPEVWFGLAELGQATGDRSLTTSSLDTLVGIPGLDPAWGARIAEIYLRDGRGAEGIRFFEPADRPGRGAGLARLHGDAMRVAYALGRYAEAAAAGEKALAADPSSAPTLRDLGWAYLRDGRLEQAEATWRRYAASWPDRAEPHGLLAQALIARGAFADAVEEARRESALDPESTPAGLRLVRAYAAASRMAEAREAGERLAAAHPDDVVVQLRHAEVLSRMRDAPAAARQWKRVLDLDPTSARAQIRWIRALQESGDDEAARAEATRLAGLDAPPEGALVFLAEDDLIRGDLQAAARSYRRLTQAFPSRARYWLELVRTLRDLQRTPERLAAIGSALAIHPGRLELETERAEALLESGRWSASAEAYERLYRRHPDNRVAFRGLMEALLASGRYDDALWHLQRRRDLFANDYEPTWWRTTALAALGRPDEAVRELDGVVNRPRDVVDVPILLYHGIVEGRRGLEIDASAFASQMRALEGAGYTTITITELAAMESGRMRFPPKPIAVTFDDARTDSFRYADAVLAELGMKATMFVPTAPVADADLFHAGWPTMSRYAATGRWDLQAHGHESHLPIPVDARGGTGRFLTDRLWLDDEERAESPDEFRARLDADYARCRDLVAEKTAVAPPIAYAFPYSEIGQRAGGSEPDAVSVNDALFRKHYRYGMSQDGVGFNAIRVGARGPRQLYRFEPIRGWNGAQLLVHLAAKEPANAARVRRARVWIGEERSRAARGEAAALAGRDSGLRAERYQIDAEAAVLEGRDRQAKRAVAAKVAAGGEVPPADSGLGRRLRWENGLQVSCGARVQGDSDGRGSVRLGPHVRWPLEAPVDLEFEASGVRFADRGFPGRNGRELSALASADVGARWKLSAFARQRALEDLDATWAGGVGATLRFDRNEVSLDIATRDVDTLPALEAGLAETEVAVGWAARRGLWRLWSRAARRDIDDGNAIAEARATLMRRLPEVRGLDVGGSLETSDSDRPSSLYYAPRGLVAVRARARFTLPLRGGSSLSFEGGYGVARDDTKGTRGVGTAQARGTWMITPRIAARFEARYAANPDYRDRGAEFSVAWLR